MPEFILAWLGVQQILLESWHENHASIKLVVSKSYMHTSYFAQNTQSKSRAT
jgi:hypothetical protein